MAASQNIARLGIVLGLDSAELVTKITEAQQKFGQFKAQIKRDSEDAAKEIVRLEYATKNYGKTLTEVEKINQQIELGKYKNQPDVIVNALKAKAAAYDKVAQAAKAASEAEMMNGGKGLTNFQRQAIMYQTTDTVTSLMGGQNPLMVLMQQGGQLKDQFGGLRPMFAGLAAAITPVGVAITGVAAAVGGLGLAFYKGYEEQKLFQNALTLTGNYAAMTKLRFDETAKSISSKFGTSLGDAKAGLQELVASGQFTQTSLSAVAEVVSRISKLTGESSDVVAKNLIPSLDGSAASAKKLNDQYHFLTLTQYKYIEQLNQQGRQQEAVRYTADLMSQNLAKQTESLGYLEKMWKSVTNTMSEYWQTAKELGKDDLSSQIRQAAKEAEAYTKAWGSGDIRTIQKMQEYLALAEKLNKQSADADAASVQAAKEKAKIDAYEGSGGASKDRQLAAQRATMIAEARYEAESVGLEKTAQIRKRVEFEIAKAEAEQARANADEKFSHSLERERLLAEQIKQIKAKGLMDEENLYKASRDKFRDSQKAEQDAIDKERERLEIYKANVFTSKEDLDLALNRLAVQQKLADIDKQKDMKQSDKDEAKQRAEWLGKEQEALIKQAETLKMLQEVNQAVYANMTTALQNFVQTGKLSFKDFATGIINELINIQIRAMAVKMTTGLGNLFGFAAAASGSGGQVAIDGEMSGMTVSQYFGAGKANGGPITGGTPYLVGEQGPEIFIPQGSGTIIPNGQVGSMQQQVGPTIQYNGPYIASMSAIDTQSATQFLAKNKMAVWSANQSAGRSVPSSR